MGRKPRIPSGHGRPSLQGRSTNVTTEITWKDLSAIHKAGALSRPLLGAWESSHTKKDEPASVLGGAAALEYRAKLYGGLRLLLLATWAVGLLIATIWKVELPMLWLVLLLALTGILMFPSPLDHIDQEERTTVRKFARDLSQLCDHLGKTPAALAQMDEQALKNLATRFLRSAAGEVAKLDPKSTWSTQNQAHEKMRRDFRDLFDFFKSFGLAERSGWHSYFTGMSTQESQPLETGDRNQTA